MHGPQLARVPEPAALADDGLDGGGAEECDGARREDPRATYGSSSAPASTDDYRPASSSSPQVEAGALYFGATADDITDA
ncbi:MAG: hypothetical protein ACO26C_06935, partial [Ilumatobacteraceae bacterium]